MKGKQVKIWEKYKIENGNLIRTNKVCPKCGYTFLAKHKDRLVCGRCHYTEIINNKAQ